jgi:hypothetical protein
VEFKMPGAGNPLQVTVQVTGGSMQHGEIMVVLGAITRSCLNMYPLHHTEIIVGS